MKRIQNLKGWIYTSLLGFYCYFLLWSPVEAAGLNSEELQQGMANLWDKYWFYLAVIVALGVLTGLLAFIVLFMRLGANSTNPQERSRIFKEMLAVAISTAALGSITFIVTVYLSLFN